VQRIAPQFGKHRYLTKGEASAFLTRDWQIQEATEFAGRLFKRLMYFTWFTAGKRDQALDCLTGYSRAKMRSRSATHCSAASRRARSCCLACAAPRARR
jgi:hypothetical protein